MDVLTFCVVLFSAAVSAFGVGGGSIFMLYLTLYKHVEQLTAQGINLLFFLPCAGVAICVYTYKKIIRFEKIWPCILGGVLGVFLGTFLLQYVKTQWLKTCFALFLCFCGVKGFFPKKKE